MDISGTSSQDTADLISDLNVSDWEHVDQRSVDQKTNVGPSGWYSAGNETNLGTSCWGSPDHGTVVEPSGWGMANQGPTLDQPLPSRWGSVDQQANMSPSVLGASGWESADNSTGMCTSDSMDEDVDEDCPRMYEECNDSSGYYATQMSPDVYKSQTSAYTKSAVEDLIRSPEYLRKHTRCTLCWCVWSEGMTNDKCMECGGYAMQKPCPICTGKCGQVWTRDVEMSHSFNEAHWDGTCGMPEEEQHRYMTSVLMEEATEESVLDALQDLNTR